MTDPAGKLAAFAREHAPLLVLTGAGVSTASGVLDYRDRDGQWKLPQPVTIGDYMASHAARARYWLRSMRGWPQFSRARPNAAHVALVEAERRLLLVGVVTQNVDGLHQAAGSRTVIDLHGRNDVVLCVECGARTPRDVVQDWLVEHNAGFAGRPADPAPDGHAHLADSDDLDAFAVPCCRACGGVVRPDVVFFGDNVPRERVERAYAWTAECGGLLALGTSLMVYSGLRFCRRARDLGKPVAIVNQGRTRADTFARLCLDAPVHELLPAVFGHGGGATGTP